MFKYIRLFVSAVLLLVFSFSLFSQEKSVSISIYDLLDKSAEYYSSSFPYYQGGYLKQSKNLDVTLYIKEIVRLLKYQNRYKEFRYLIDSFTQHMDNGLVRVVVVKHALPEQGFNWFFVGDKKSIKNNSSLTTVQKKTGLTVMRIGKNEKNIKKIVSQILSMHSGKCVVGVSEQFLKEYKRNKAYFLSSFFKIISFNHYRRTRFFFPISISGRNVAEEFLCQMTATHIQTLFLRQVFQMDKNAPRNLGDYILHSAAKDSLASYSYYFHCINMEQAYSMIKTIPNAVQNGTLASYWEKQYANALQFYAFLQKLPKISDEKKRHMEMLVVARTYCTMLPWLFMYSNMRGGGNDQVVVMIMNKVVRVLVKIEELYKKYDPFVIQFLKKTRKIFN